MYKLDATFTINMYPYITQNIKVFLTLNLSTLCLFYRFVTFTIFRFFFILLILEILKKQITQNNFFKEMNLLLNYIFLYIIFEVYLLCNLL